MVDRWMMAHLTCRFDSTIAHNREEHISTLDIARILFLYSFPFHWYLQNSALKVMYWHLQQHGVGGGEWLYVLAGIPVAEVCN